MPHQNRHFAGDPHANAGVWGPPTSTANFCEEDYAVTRFIAEFINSLTNLAYIYIALRHSRSPQRGGALVFGLDTMAVSLFLVGVASFAYHATLRQHAQYGDELSMLFLGAAVLHPLYASGRGAGARLAIGAGLAAAVAAFCAYYVRHPSVLYHLLAFSAMVHSIWPRTLYLINRHAERARLRRRFRAAATAFVLAFVIWNVDLERCLALRRLRSRVGLPWAWALELHGWWHILTAWAAGEYMELVRELCTEKVAVS